MKESLLTLFMPLGVFFFFLSATYPLKPDHRATHLKEQFSLIKDHFRHILSLSTEFMEFLDKRNERHLFPVIHTY